jgi:2-hydroxycyclohexanecarboxyl-CoA dehydrogenase
VYSGTKGGVIAVSEGLAREVAKRGVTVKVVCPGPTDTALLDQVAEASQRLHDGLARAVPMGRIATPEDIAPAVAFFASDEAGYVTGQTLSVSWARRALDDEPTRPAQCAGYEDGRGPEPCV